jgi:hypothetical protein
MGANCTRWLERLPTGRAAVAVWPGGVAPGVVDSVAVGLAVLPAGGGVAVLRVEAVLQPPRAPAATSPAIAGNKRLT